MYLIPSVSADYFIYALSKKYVNHCWQHICNNNRRIAPFFCYLSLLVDNSSLLFARKEQQNVSPVLRKRPALLHMSLIFTSIESRSVPRSSWGSFSKAKRMGKAVVGRRNKWVGRIYVARS
jgi:hypothetical protein